MLWLVARSQSGLITDAQKSTFFYAASGSGKCTPGRARKRPAPSSTTRPKIESKAGRYPDHEVRGFVRVRQCIGKFEEHKKQ
jgi:hypothetical protein